MCWREPLRYPRQHLLLGFGSFASRPRPALSRRWWLSAARVWLVLESDQSLGVPSWLNVRIRIFPSHAGLSRSISSLVTVLVERTRSSARATTAGPDVHPRAHLQPQTRHRRPVRRVRARAGSATPARRLIAVSCNGTGVDDTTIAQGGSRWYPSSVRASAPIRQKRVPRRPTAQFRSLAAANDSAPRQPVPARNTHDKLRQARQNLGTRPQRIGSEVSCRFGW
jgi:hypothetical protein